MATVTYDHVTKSFGDFTAVKDLNLQVRDEEFLVLVGPSGCGEYDERSGCSPDSEDADQRATSSSPSACVNTMPRRRDRDVAMVFQNYALYPHMSSRTTTSRIRSA